MPKFTITLSATNHEQLRQCLHSIANTGESNIEVVVNNAIETDKISSVIREFGAIELKKRTNILESRYVTGMVASGEFTIILDDTRVVPEDFFRSLPPRPPPISCLPERTKGSSLFALFAKKDEQVTGKYGDESLGPENVRFILPRLYETSVLKRSLSNVRSKLPADVFLCINAMDLELIYFEAYSECKAVNVLRDCYLLHVNEGSSLSQIRKYLKYGSNTRLLANTAYRSLGNIGGRLRLIRPSSLYEAVSILGLTVLRGVPFIVGYVLGHHKPPHVI